MWQAQTHLSDAAVRHYAGTGSAGELHKIPALDSETGLQMWRRNNGVEGVFRRQKAGQV